MGGSLQGVVYGPPPVPNRKKWPYQATAVFQGMRINIENKVGSTRRGVDRDGKKWAITMKAAYGEFVDTLGSDGDPVDVYIGPHAESPWAYVVHQKFPRTQVHDEDKVLLGCRTLTEARELYLAHYDKPGFWGGATRWPITELREYLRRRAARGKRLDKPIVVRALIKCGPQGIAQREKLIQHIQRVLGPTTPMQKARRRVVIRIGALTPGR